MATLGMGRSYDLTYEEIDNIIDENRIGNYAYGFINDNGSFVVRYVGRADKDLRERIKHGVMDMKLDSSYRYERFKYSYATSVTEAYEKECRNYHDFGGDSGLLCNKIHPSKPECSTRGCPVCGN